MNDFFIVTQWYLVFLLIGVSFLPLTMLIFSNLFDRGYIFAKVLGTLFISYTVFLLGTLKIVPFHLPSLLFIAFAFLAINIWIFHRYVNKEKLLSLWKLFAVEELLFFIALVAWSFIRAHDPSINGLEKFMDFGFVNSILRGEYFPPIDMWFPPFPINYYYFGHLVTAVLTKLSLLPSNYTYNLMIATLFALTFTASYSIGFNLLQALRVSMKKSLATGFLSGLLVALSGNLHIIYAFFAPYVPPENPVPPWQLAFKPLDIFSSNGYWYPNATRFIPNTIHEFPSYSFVVSDLHGHVLDIPVVLTCIALLLTFLIAKKTRFWTLLLLGFLLACMYMTNVLDFGIYLLLSSFTLAYLYNKQLKFTARRAKPKGIQRYFPLFTKKITNGKTIAIQFLQDMAIVVGSAIIFSLPFSAFFKPFASGIGILCAPTFLTDKGKIGPFLFEANHCERSEWWMLLILYGFFYFFVTILFIYLIKNQKDKVKAPFVFAVILVILSTVLIAIPEFAYIKDIYPQHYRANTMFKLTYQAFIMLSLVSAFVVGAVVTTKRRLVIGSTSLVLITLVMLYPRFAINSYYGSYQGLNGTAYLKERFPSDYEAILWINKHISGQPVMLEAQGDSYTDYERISANTGLPTVLGWTVHEWLWRGSYEVPAPRITDVQTLYESTSDTETRALLAKYNVQYVYVGGLELEKYPNLFEEKFLRLGKIVYQNQEVKIYKINL